MTRIDAAPIRNLNNRFRCQMDHTLGRWVISSGVNSKGGLFVQRACRAVQQFTEFNEGNDPHFEADFGKIELDGETLFWKIDVFSDSKCEFGSEDPSDPKRSYRVMTVLLSSEY
jgi:Protein of unknown function (DUF3768)